MDCQWLKNLSFKAVFKRTGSPNQTASAKSEGSGSSQASIGDSCVQAGRDINYYSNKRNPVEDADAWENLIGCFTEVRAQKIIEMVNDHRMQWDLQHNLKGTTQSLKNNFKLVVVHQKDEEELVEIREQALAAIDSFIETRNAEFFTQTWLSLHEALKYLKGRRNRQDL
jgi:hypothetical protein